MFRAEGCLPRPSPTCLTFYRAYAVARCRTRPAFHHKQRSHWHLRVTVSTPTVLVYPTEIGWSRIDYASYQAIMIVEQNGISHPTPSPTPVEPATGRAVGLRPTGFVPPPLMARLQERRELLSRPSRLELTVAASSGDIDRRVVVGVQPPATDPTAKRLLYGAIAPVDKMATRAFLRGIGALD
jgi:hypothetical protein